MIMPRLVIKSRLKRQAFSKKGDGGEKGGEKPRASRGPDENPAVIYHPPSSSWTERTIYN